MAALDPRSTVAARPAETGGLAAALAVLIAYFAGLDDPAVIAALVIVVGALPAVITWCVVKYREAKEGGSNAQDTRPA